ncbi:hypothetical protein [Actinorugispora endophytica]|uniref:Uncharacterized protein n=1 Tax=Actinorugispora endophytica TaxID=1605990 RepID=A0A4R6V6I0_9ACTN|nr:hypothetical protein [Actinorugispora endophytica]TDQ54792.1 hypothetical protein EV190_101108 [Actinorugispora endophytica]
MTLRPYEVAPDDIPSHLGELVQSTFDDLTSQFMLLPRGASFLEYPEFRSGYEALRKHTNGFTVLDVDRCWNAVKQCAIAGIVLRTIVGVTPPEWQDLAKEETDQQFPNNWARGLDKHMKTNPAYFSTRGGSSELTVSRVTALFQAACRVLLEGATDSQDGMIHRLDKLDTKEGLDSIRYVAEQHVPYAVLLYERYLGRPFASHRDGVSELVGDVMENAIEDLLSQAGVSARKTKRAERVPGFDQAPDFFIPDELDPTVIIEAKITGDDGTARDKVSRILRLASMRDEREREGRPSFEVVACIDGRGFGVRREDMGQMIAATRGKVFTANSLKDLIRYTRISEFLPEP